MSSKRIVSDSIYIDKLREVVSSNLGGRSEEPARLLNHVWLGSQRNAESYRVLQKIGVTHVLNCAGYKGPRENPDANPYEGLNIEYKEFKADDEDNYDMTQHFREAFNFLDRVSRSGGVCLVHCALGINRSAAVCVAYLMMHQKMPLIEAASFIKQRRRVMLSNAGFRRQLVRWARLKGLLDDIPEEKFEEDVKKYTRRVKYGTCEDDVKKYPQRGNYEACNDDIKNYTQRGSFESCDDIIKKHIRGGNYGSYDDDKNYTQRDNYESCDDIIKKHIRGGNYGSYDDDPKSYTQRSKFESCDDIIKKHIRGGNYGSYDDDMKNYNQRGKFESCDDIIKKYTRGTNYGSYEDDVIHERPSRSLDRDLHREPRSSSLSSYSYQSRNSAPSRTEYEPSQFKRGEYQQGDACLEYMYNRFINRDKY